MTIRLLDQAEGTDLRAELRRIREQAGPGKALPDRCSSCRGTGYAPSRPPAFPGEDVPVARCEACRPSPDELLTRAGVPEHERGARLEADIAEQNQKAAKLLSALVSDRFLLEGSTVPRSLYFEGGYGAGKSWLAAAVARAAVERLRWSVGWVTVRDLLRELHAVYQSQQREDGGDSEHAILRRYQVPRLLVLNELPRVRQTPWVAEQIEGLIDHRISAAKVTIVTSNASLEDVAQLYNGALASRLGPRFFERVPFGGVDMRGVEA